MSPSQSQKGNEMNNSMEARIAAYEARTAAYEANLAAYEAGLELNEAEAAFLVNAYEMHASYSSRNPCDALKVMMEALGQSPDDYADHEDVDITKLSPEDLAIFGKLMGMGLVELYGENNTFVKLTSELGEYALNAVEGRYHHLHKPAPVVPVEEPAPFKKTISVGRCWKPGRRRGFDYEAAILAEGDRYWM